MARYAATLLFVFAPLSSSAFLLELSLRNGCSASRRRPVSVAAIDAETMRECAIYDATMDSELRDLKARVQSAEFHAEQQRGLVEMAQKTLWEQNNLTRTLKAQVASLVTLQSATSSPFTRSLEWRGPAARAPHDTTTPLHHHTTTPLHRSLRRLPRSRQSGTPQAEPEEVA